MKLEKLQTLVIGGTGLAASQVAEAGIAQIQAPPTDWVNAIVQALIALGTILSLFKSNKNGKN